MHQRQVFGPTILAALLFSLACAPKNPNELSGGSPDGTHVLVVHGVVTHAVTGVPIGNVTVTLHSADNLPSTTTDATGYFQFRNLAQANNLIVEFSKAGYKTVSATVDVRAAGGITLSSDGGITIGLGGQSNADSIDASMKLAPDIELAVAGWVWAGTSPAVGANVVLFKDKTACSGDGASPSVGDYFGQTQADAAGHFRFDQVPPGTYEIRVWPYDKTGSGVASYQLYWRCLGAVDFNSDPSGQDGNLTNLSLVLEDEASSIVGSSFQNLTTDFESGYSSDGYPWSTGTVTSTSTFIAGGANVTCSVCGVGGTLIGANAPIWLHFGAIVDPTSAVFELVDMDLGNGSSTYSFGTPMKITWTWDHGVIVTIAVDPSNPLVTTADPHRRYQLRIKSLQFADGSFFIDPRNQTPGRITFDYVTTPTYLSNPTPALFFDNYIGFTSVGAKQTTSRVVVDAATLWDLDSNGDFVFGYLPGSQQAGVSSTGSSTGFQLKWQQQQGAVNYAIYARNTTTNGSIGDNKRLWRKVNGTLEFQVDPNGQSTILATGVMGSGALAKLSDFGATWVVPPTTNCSPNRKASGCSGGTFSYPFLFGNPIQVAVTSIDKDGYESPIDPSKTLSLQDTFGPLVQTGSPGLDNGNGLQSDYRNGCPSCNPESSVSNFISQRGQLFRKILTIPWSEPLVTTTAPVITARSGQVKILQQQASQWDPYNFFDSPTNISDLTAVPLLLSGPGPCTEVLVARTGVPAGVNPARGDTIIPVRNAGLFSVSATARVLFVAFGGGSFGSGVWTDEITGVTAVDAVNNRITLAQGLQNSVAANSFACLVDAPSTQAQGLISVGGTAGTDVAVNNAGMFMVGQTIVIYRPQTGGNPNQIFDVLTVKGMDTVASPNFITVSSAPSVGHNATSVVFPLPVGGLYSTWGPYLYPGVCCGYGEYNLRTSMPFDGASGRPSLKTDIVGGPNTVVTLTAAANFLSVGDTVVFDVDGDTTHTFVDQTLTTVKSIQFDTSATTPSFTFTVDLPANTVYIHGQSKVIALGDAFTVTGVQDTSGTAANPHTVNTHQDTFTADGFIY